MFPYYCMARSLRRQADQTLGVYNIARTQQNGARKRNCLYTNLFNHISPLLFHGIKARLSKLSSSYFSIMSGGGKKRFVIESHSPYYLHPSEGPGVLITAVIFDGKNFDLWERAVRTALIAKNKLGFIDGTLTRPAETSDVDFSEVNAWDMANSMLCSWLLNIIDPKLRMSVAY